MVDRGPELAAVRDFLVEGHEIVLMATIGVQADGQPVMRMAMPPEIRQLDDHLWGFFWEQLEAAARKLRESPLDDLSWAGPYV